ncbi:MAG: cytochrome B, partial [Rhodocyclaceae bacterium]|nr:cytochrome B [Rhodocyclaceae bacterium]
ALVCLHVASIVFYALVKKHFLVPPMITGKTRVPADSPAQDAQGGSVKALVVALLIAAAAMYVAAGG